VKISILLLLFFGAILFGCSDNFDNTLVSTPTQTKNSTNSVISKDIIKSVLKDTDRAISPLIIKSKLINGETGGWLFVDTTYVNYQGREIYVYAYVDVRQNAFLGTREFTMILNPEEATVQFLPHMVFNNILRVSVWYVGIDLKSLDYNTTSHVDFAYFDDEGNIDIIPSQQTHINVTTSTIKVNNAQLSHFSRYGWVRGQQ
jgi:hypothetical protein